MQLDTPDQRMSAAKKIIQSYPDALETQVREVGGLNKRQAAEYLQNPEDNSKPNHFDEAIEMLEDFTSKTR